MVIAELRGSELLLVKYLRRLPEPTVGLILDFARSEAWAAKSEACTHRAKPEPEPVATGSKPKKSRVEQAHLELTV